MTEEKTFTTAPLTYGAIISISQPSDENLVIYSEGMIKTQVYLEDLNQNGKEASFYRSLFQIYPSFVNTYKKEALTLKTNIESNNVEESKLKQTLDELKEKLTMEYKFNLEYYEKMKNTHIAFDQPVQFLHLASNKFLACSFKEADVEKENYKLELEDIPSEATNFKISPSYKHQKESEGSIFFGDLMFITYSTYFLNKIPYIQCSYQEEGNTSLIKNIYTFETHSHNFGDERVMLDVQRATTEFKHNANTKQFIKREVNMSLEVSTRWRINLFALNETDLENFLAYGNIIWMNHVESNASMIAKKQDDLLTIDFARTIVADHFQQYVGNTNGMWIIENEDHLAGGPIHCDDKFRLKHFSSGRYLTVSKNSHKKNHHLTLEHDKTKDNLFQFVMVYASESKTNNIRAKLITKETFTRIKSCSTNHWVSVQLNDDRMEATLARKPLDDDIFKLLKANNSEIWETSFIICCYPILKDFITFVQNMNHQQEISAKKIFNKFKEAQDCIHQLEQFCTNRLLNTSPDQKYGEINPFRQKVLREQYFIEVLTQILKVVWTPQGFEKAFDLQSTARGNKKTAKGSFKFLVKKVIASRKTRKENEQQLIDEKTKICKSIYSLIKNICNANPENELYAYKLLHDFQYHARYFQEAVDCFVSIIGPNQTILSRINEDTDIKGVQKDLGEVEEVDEGPKKKQVEIFNIKVIFDKKNDKSDYKAQNFVTYFLSLLKSTNSIESNKGYLNFLRAICTCKNRGITTNQEMLFKIFSEYKDLENSVFLPVKISADKIEIGIDDTKYISLNNYLKEDNTITAYKNEIAYFQEQMKFYSDLLLDRNYLWKNKLEKQFPLKFVFEQIYNASLSLGLRSIFCSLAFTLYIDHEPLNSKVIPNLCRIFKSNHLRNQPSLLTSTEKLHGLDQENFSVLLENLMKIIQDKKEKISAKLHEDYDSNTDEVIKPKQGENFLDNVLMASVISLLSKMTRYDLLTILNKNNFYYELVHVLLHILEYEKRNPSMSYVLDLVREDRCSKEDDKKTNVMGKFGGFMGDLSKGVVGVVGQMKNLANDLIGNTQKKKDQGNRAMDTEAEDSALFSHPIMKGLIDIKQQLDQLVIDHKKIENVHEIVIKEEICNLFAFMIDLRQDFLVSNMIGWYDNVVFKHTSSGTKDTIANLVEQEVNKVLPRIPKTGIKDIDDKFNQKEESNGLLDMKDIIKKSKQKLLNSVKDEENFVKYTEDTEIPDLETLFSQNPKQPPVETTKPILPSLLTTFYLCNDTNLQNKLLTVIMRMFNQKQELAQNMTDLEVIFQKKNITAYHKLEAWMTNLRLQTETSEIWLDNFISSKGENGEGVKKVCELLTNIQMLFSRLTHRSAKYYQSRQNMIRNMSGFTPMIELVRDGISHLRKALANPSFPEAAMQKLFKMFQLIHSCLICFAMNNEANQEILAQHMRLFLSNLELDLGQIPLICEICRDNKLICETFADTIMTHLTDAIMFHGHKITYLEPLIVLQSQKGIVFVDNQIKILDQFLPTNSFYKDKEMELLYASDETGQIEFEFRKLKPLDQPFIYHTQLFNILVPQDKASEQLSFIHARLRKIFNIPYCFNLLLQPDSLNNSELRTITIKPEAPRHDNNLLFDRDFNVESAEKGFAILKPKILELIDTLYLKSDKKLAQEFLEHIQGLTEFLTFEQNRLKSFDDNTRLDPKLLHYILDCLIPFLNSYVNKLIKETSEEVRERRGNNAISSYVHILYEKSHIVTAGLSKEKCGPIVELFSCYYEDDTVKSRIFDKEDGMRPPASSHGEEPKTPFEFKEFEFDDHEEDGPAEDKASFEKYEDLWNDDFRPCFLESKSLEKEIKNEKIALSEAIWRFAQIVPEEQKKKYSIDFDEKALLKKLIMFLQYGIAHKAEKVTMISTLRVLRTLIEEAPDMTEMQNTFDRNDATMMLLSVFSDSKNSIKDDDLLNEFLLFWISLLEGGNLTVQKTIHKFCTVYPKSEAMFSKFHSIIYEQIEYLQMKTSMKNDNNQKIHERTDLKSTILENLLRLLQLFTEGHNLDLQNYLRFQTNSRNRYNIVEAVIELLRIYYEDLVQENYDNIVRCLDTLNEFVQGPCPENQIALIDGKFFDVAVGLLSKNIPKEKKSLKDFPNAKSSTIYTSMAIVSAQRLSQKNKPLDRWMLARLKYKVLILINSLLEMRTSDTVIRRIMRSLPMEILKTNLVKVFRRYKKQYGASYTMDAFKHFEGDFRDRENDKPPEYYENIVETGFLIYFLISSYLEANVQDIDLQNEIQEMQEGMAGQDAMLQDFLKNNVVGQLGRFGYSFLKSGFDSLSVLKKQMDKKLKGKEEPKEEEKKFRKALLYRQLVSESMDFFGKNSAHIEVVRNKNIEKVYFIVLPFCKELPKETKNDFNEKVNRQSPQTKVSDLIENSEEIIKICKHELRLKLFFGRNKVIAVFANFVNLWKDLAFFMTVLLNVFILGSYSIRNDMNDEEQDPEVRLEYPVLFLDETISRETTLDVFLICGIIMAVSSVFVVIFFLLKRAPLIFEKAWQDEEVAPGEEEEAKKKKLSPMTIIKKLIRVILLSLMSVDIVYYIGYGVFAIIGTVAHPFFFAFHLTEILIRYPTLKNVIKAFWEPKVQLGLTFLLYMILNYIFSLVAFEFFSEDYQGDCESTWLCFLNTYDYTWKANGGIGGHLDDINDPERGKYGIGRFFFDYFFNMILVVIMINIVAGIIIDTFGLLREEEEEKNADIEEKCFICGLGKEVFDRQADTGYDFTMHIKKDHYMWNYVFFVAYLKDKEETEYTGIESYIAERLQNSDFTSWFPFLKALALTVHEEDEEDKQREILSSMQTEMDAIKKGMKDLTGVYGGLVSKLSAV